MIRVGDIPSQIRHGGMYRAGLWASLAVTLYILAYVLAKNNANIDFGDFPSSWEVPIQEPIDSVFGWVGDTFSWFFNPISDVVDLGLAWIDSFLLWLPWPVVVAATTLVGLRLSGVGLAVFCALSSMFFGVIGLWDSTMLTLSVMGVSVILAVAVGVPVGILAGYNNRFEAVVRPILDTMQVLPPFVYLIPALVLFGVSGTQGVFLTVVYSIPPVIRLTNLGIRQVPRAAIETAQSHGSTNLQTLFQVQLPLAKSSIMMGINQTIMMAVAMVIITALVGVIGLGKEVWVALRQVDAGAGLESGVAIVLLAIILDRFSYAMSKSNQQSTLRDGSLKNTHAPESAKTTHPAVGAISEVFDRFGVQITGGLVIVILLIFSTVWDGAKEFPEALTFSVSNVVNEAADWIAVNLYFITSWIRDSLFREFGFGPIQTLLLWLPWPAVIILSAGLAFAVAGRNVAILAALGLMLAGIGGIWEVTMDTLSQVLTGGVFTVIFGIVLGVLASQSRTFESIIRPILDTMQTMPIFVYLIPVIMLWGIGPIVGIIATVVYALPPVIRMTSLGIKQVPPQVIETAQSHGSTGLQTLLQVQIPLAFPTIMMGVNQTIIMVLAMVIIAGLVGGGGLGQEVYVNSIYLRMGHGLVSGLTIVIMAMVLDRMTQGKSGLARTFSMAR